MRESLRAPERDPLVWCLVATLVVAAGGLHVGLLAGLTEVGGGPRVPWLLLVAGFAIAELCVVHLTIGREAVSFAFAEIPLVVGLFLTTPTSTVTAAVAGSAVVLAWHRRQTPLKLAFNLAQRWFGAVVAVALWRALVGPGDAHSLRGSLAALLAAVTIELVAALCITAAIALRSGRGAGPVPVALGTGLLASSANACFALAALDVLRVDWQGIWTVAVLAGFLGLAQRAHMAVLRRHDALERMQGFTRAIGAGDLQLDVVVGQVLTGVRDLLEVESVALDLLDGSWTCDGGGIARTDAAGPAEPSALQRRRSEVASLTVALHGEDGELGTLTAAGRQGDVGGLRQDDLKLLEAVAGHVAVALHNGRLADRLRTAADENRHQALHDALTGLPNRSMFDGVATEVLLQGSSSAVLLLDLDRFKEVNDTLGHAAGDAVLQEVSGRLARVLPQAACVARLGGDEFAVVLPGADTAKALDVARTILGVLAQPMELEGVTLAVDASIGVALAPEHGLDVASLLRRADVAMYAAKDTHEGLVLYAPERDHHCAERLSMVADLRAAIEQDQLVLAYQPKTCTAGGGVPGVEALVRWQHPTRGLVPPDEFIGVAEQTGLIGGLTDWVVRRALAQCRQWLDDGLDLGVAINISPRTLLDAEFPSRLAEQLAAARVPASRITLEVTEGALMTEPERAVDVLWQLRRQGLRLSVDDLGVGHSSLAYLKRLPVHEIKIDRSFVTNMVDDADDEAIVSSLVLLVHRLRMTVVAEGVEDQRTLDALAVLGADHAQGYWMSKPLPAGEIPDWLSRWTGRRGLSLLPAQRVEAS